MCTCAKRLVLFLVFSPGGPPLSRVFLRPSAQLPSDSRPICPTFSLLWGPKTFLGRFISVRFLSAWGQRRSSHLLCFGPSHLRTSPARIEAGNFKCYSLWLKLQLSLS